MESLSVSSRLKEIFKGVEIPDVVYVPPGTAYYKDLEDIPTESFRNSAVTPKVDKLESRSMVVLKIASPLPGEPTDASFQVRGERGLYVRAILDKNFVQGDPKDTRWVPYNKMDQKTFRYM